MRGLNWKGDEYRQNLFVAIGRWHASAKKDESLCFDRKAGIEKGERKQRELKR